MDAPRGLPARGVARSAPEESLCRSARPRRGDAASREKSRRRLQQPIQGAGVRRRRPETSGRPQRTRPAPGVARVAERAMGPHCHVDCLGVADLRLHHRAFQPRHHAPLAPERARASQQRPRSALAAAETRQGARCRDRYRRHREGALRRRAARRAPRRRSTCQRRGTWPRRVTGPRRSTCQRRRRPRAFGGSRRQRRACDRRGTCACRGPPAPEWPRGPCGEGACPTPAPPGARGWRGGRGGGSQSRPRSAFQRPWRHGAPHGGLAAARGHAVAAALRAPAPGLWTRGSCALALTLRPRRGGRDTRPVCSLGGALRRGGPFLIGGPCELWDARGGLMGRRRASAPDGDGHRPRVPGPWP
mmetsp:Transcript_85736/g.239712  ORF Transcript_85736/g.239712 Transcript_85736/m.239712 type:complete len:360 (+) Transcript_85736:1416-2495(+)